MTHNRHQNVQLLSHCKTLYIVYDKEKMVKKTMILIAQRMLWHKTTQLLNVIYHWKRMLEIYWTDCIKCHHFARMSTSSIWKYVSYHCKIYCLCGSFITASGINIDIVSAKNELKISTFYFCFYETEQLQWETKWSLHSPCRTLFRLYHYRYEMVLRSFYFTAWLLRLIVKEHLVF